MLDPASAKESVLHLEQVAVRVKEGAVVAKVEQAGVCMRLFLEPHVERIPRLPQRHMR